MIVRWNSGGSAGLLIDDNMDPRALIYHEDINVKSSGSIGPDGRGVLSCRYSGSDPGATWRRPDDTIIVAESTSNDFRQFRTAQADRPPTRVQLARTRSSLQDGASNDGLWTCNGGGLPRRHVALYARGIASNSVNSCNLS